MTGEENVSITMKNQEDLEIEAEIDKELAALVLEECDFVNPNDVISVPAPEPEKDFGVYDSCIDQYLNLIKYNEEKANKNLFDAKQILETSEEDLMNAVDKLITEKLKHVLDSDESSTDGKDLLQLRARVLAEVEELESIEEKEFATVKAEDLNLAVAVIKPDADIIEEIKQYEEDGRRKLKLFREQQEQEERIREEARRKRLEQQSKLDEEYERKNCKRLEDVELSLDRFKDKERDQPLMTEEYKSLFTEIEQNFEKSIKEMDMLREKEMMEFEAFKKKVDEERKRKKENAALVLQKRYRGYRVRKVHKPELENLKMIRLRKKQEKLDEIERQERLEKEAAEMKRKELEEKRKLEKEKKEKEEMQRKLHEEKLEKERIEKAKMEAQRKKAEKERIEKEKLESERLEKERVELEKEMERQRLEKERIENERLEKEKLERERLQRERIELEKEMERQRLEKERIENERLEKEKLERERLQKERIELEKEMERKRLEKERIEKERLEKERREKDREEKERMKQKTLEKQAEEVKEDRQSMKMQNVEEDESKKKSLTTIETKEDQKDTGNLKNRLENIKLSGKKENVDEGNLEDTQQQGAKIKESIDDSREELQRDENQREKIKSEDGMPQKDLELPERLEMKRKQWLKEHTRYRVSIDDSRTQPVARLRSRSNQRKVSANLNLPVLTSSQILSIAPNETSLQMVECVALQDLNGVRMSIIDSCSNLKMIELNNCGIEELEGIENCNKIQKISLPRNKISSFFLLPKTSLREVVLSENKLSSVKGLECLSNLQVLNLSCNRITRLGGLSSCKRLQDLDLGSNQLISLKGLESLQRLLILKVANNHLASAEEVGSLSLLHHLDLHGNTINRVPTLKNNVLLRELFLDGNNLTSLESFTDCWLPSFEKLNISGNRIEEIPLMEHLCMLKDFDVRDNLIKESSKLLDGIENCRRLQTIKISGNPVEGTPNIRSLVQLKLTHLVFLDETKLRDVFPDDFHSNRPFDEMCRKQLSEEDEDLRRFLQEISEAKSNSNRYDFELTELKSETHYRNQRFKLALKHLWEHENFGGEDVSIPEEFMNNLEAAENEMVTASASPDFSPYESKMQQNRRKFADQNTPANETMNLRAPSQGFLGSFENRESKEQQDTLNDDQELLTQIPKQAADLYDRQMKAATKIQAVFRGYKVRCAIFAALQSARCHENDEDDDFDYDEEVDLSAFDYDDENHDWNPSNTPQLPSRMPALPPTDDRQNEKKGPIFAWETVPATPKPSTRDVEPLNLEFSPEESENSSTLQGSDVHNKKEEIAMEWGFQSRATAEMMMKRAKKMTAAARKKNMMAPEKRYALFKKLEKTSPNVTVRPPAKKKTAERVDYFAAQREANSSLSFASVTTDQDFKEQMTYSWVCNQTVLHEEAHRDVINEQSRQPEMKKLVHKKSDSRSTNSVSLPYMDPAIIAGKNVPLVLLPSHELVLNTVDSNIQRRHSDDDQGREASSTSKSRSAPDPSHRSPPIFTYGSTGSSRSSSSESGRGRKKKIQQNR